MVWIFGKIDVNNTPSVKDGLTVETEKRYRKDGARFITDCGMHLRLGHNTIATAVVMFHRFYLKHSFKMFPRFFLASTCLMLAGKVEETPKKCRDIVAAAKYFLPSIYLSTYGSQPEKEIIIIESILLQTIQFDFGIEHPYNFLIRYAKGIEGEKAIMQDIVQMAWNFVNDSYSIILCIEWEPEILAVALLNLACDLLKFTVRNWINKTPTQRYWWDAYIAGINREELRCIGNEVLKSYEQAEEVDTSIFEEPGNAQITAKSNECGNVVKNESNTECENEPETKSGDLSSNIQQVIDTTKSTEDIATKTSNEILAVQASKLKRKITNVNGDYENDLNKKSLTVKEKDMQSNTNVTVKIITADVNLSANKTSNTNTIAYNKSPSKPIHQYNSGLLEENDKFKVLESSTEKGTSNTCATYIVQPIQHKFDTSAPIVPLNLDSATKSDVALTKETKMLTTKPVIEPAEMVQSVKSNKIDSVQAPIEKTVAQMIEIDAPKSKPALSKDSIEIATKSDILIVKPLPDNVSIQQLPIIKSPNKPEFTFTKSVENTTTVSKKLSAPALDSLEASTRIITNAKLKKSIELEMKTSPSKHKSVNAQHSAAKTTASHTDVNSAKSMNVLSEPASKSFTSFTSAGNCELNSTVKMNITAQQQPKMETTTILANSHKNNTIPLSYDIIDLTNSDPEEICDEILKVKHYKKRKSEEKFTNQAPVKKMAYETSTTQVPKSKTVEKKPTTENVFTEHSLISTHTSKKENKKIQFSKALTDKFNMLLNKPVDTTNSTVASDLNKTCNMLVNTSFESNELKTECLPVSKPTNPDSKVITNTFLNVSKPTNITFHQQSVIEINKNQIHPTNINSNESTNTQVPTTDMTKLKSLTNSNGAQMEKTAMESEQYASASELNSKILHTVLHNVLFPPPPPPPIFKETPETQLLRDAHLLPQVVFLKDKPQLVLPEDTSLPPLPKYTPQPPLPKDTPQPPPPPPIDTHQPPLLKNPSLSPLLYDTPQSPSPKYSPLPKDTSQPPLPKDTPQPPLPKDTPQPPPPPPIDTHQPPMPRTPTSSPLLYDTPQPPLPPPLPTDTSQPPLPTDTPQPPLPIVPLPYDAPNPAMITFPSVSHQSASLPTTLPINLPTNYSIYPYATADISQMQLPLFYPMPIFNSHGMEVQQGSMLPITAAQQWQMYYDLSTNQVWLPFYTDPAYISALQAYAQYMPN